MPEYILHALRKYDVFVNMEINENEIEKLLLELYNLFGSEFKGIPNSFRLREYLSWKEIMRKGMVIDSLTFFDHHID